MWVNSRGLALLGVTAETPDPPGGKIARDSSGAPSGSFADSAAIFVEEKIPSPPLEEKAALTTAELKKMSAYGITALMDAFVTPAEAAVWRIVCMTPVSSPCAFPWRFTSPARATIVTRLWPVLLRRGRPAKSIGTSYPFCAFQTAVTRIGRKGQKPLNIEERIPLTTAVDAYTINAAYAMKQDKTTGSLEVGKRADLVVLDRDIFSVDPDTIGDTKVLATYLDGRLVDPANGTSSKRPPSCEFRSGLP